MTGTYWTVSYWVLALLGVAGLTGLVWWLLRKWHDRIDSEAYDRGYKQGKSEGCTAGLAQGKIEGQAQERARQAEAEAARRRSPLGARHTHGQAVRGDAGALWDRDPPRGAGP